MMESEVKIQKKNGIQEKYPLTCKDGAWNERIDGMPG